MIKSFCFAQKLRYISCSWPAVGSNIVQITRATFFVMLFKKWPPVAILDVQKLLCIAFQINTTIFSFEIFFNKMLAGGQFGCPKITFGRISGHFRSIQNFYFEICAKMAAVGHFVRNSRSIAFLAISDRYATFFFKF